MTGAVGIRHPILLYNSKVAAPENTLRPSAGRISFNRKAAPMLGLARVIKMATAVGLTAFMVASASSPSNAETGTVRFKVAKAGFIVGVGGGTGVLNFKGKHYRLRVDGISAGTIGVAQADLVGVARNLRTASDIAGTYSAASASLAIAGGQKAATLQNANGVVLELHGKQAGFEASLNLGGVTITLEQ